MTEDTPSLSILIITLLPSSYTITPIPIPPPAAPTVTLRPPSRPPSAQAPLRPGTPPPPPPPSLTGHAPAPAINSRKYALRCGDGTRSGAKPRRTRIARELERRVRERKNSIKIRGIAFHRCSSCTVIITTIMCPGCMLTSFPNL